MITSVQYLIPPTLPVSESTRICTELLDEILYKGFGVHFLEPITI